MYSLVPRHLCTCGVEPACVYSSGAVPAWSHGHLGASEVMLSACLALVRCQPGALGTRALVELRLSARYACLRRRRLLLLVALDWGNVQQLCGLQEKSHRS